ncbi:hypothetical protein QBE54_05265 [Thermatribacter velox]|uniref:Uncharacterized protein n=1 Tax=Thermatribacter velox TaxID=3039681 RepID=A0ABZ2YDQ6_9BACT
MFNKSDYTLVSPRNPFFIEERLSRYWRISEGERLEIVLQVGEKNEVKNLFATPSLLEVVSQEEGVEVRPSQEQREVLEYLKKGFFDTFLKEDTFILEEEKNRNIFYHFKRFRPGGFYGVLHRLFPIVFIMHGIPGFQPMTWDMLVGDPYFEEKNLEELKKHYARLQWGIDEAFSEVKLKVVENLALAALNRLVAENPEDGFVKAYHLCSRLGLGFLRDFYWPATQATEQSEWVRFMKPPMPLFPWRKDGDKS